MSQVAERQETLSGAFDEWRREPAFGPAWLAEAREASFNRFLDRGFPTVRDEEWRFTNVAPIAQTVFGRAVRRRHASAYPVSVRRPGHDSRRQRPLSSSLSTPGAAGGRQRQHAGGCRASTPARVAQDAAAVPTAPVDLNGVLLKTRDGRARRKPWSRSRSMSCASWCRATARRCGAQAGPWWAKAPVTLIETHATVGARAPRSANGDGHTPPRRRSSPPGAARSAAVFHLASTSSRSRGRHLHVAGADVRRRTRETIFGGPRRRGRQCTRAALADGDAVVDTHTVIDHAKPHCSSHEVYKGILGGRSKAVFNGKIVVRQDAQKTDAKQTNKRCCGLTGDDQHEAAARTLRPAT